MKLLIIQKPGEHFENAEYREGLCLKRALERAGHSAAMCFDSGKEYNALVGLCDAVLVVENYSLEMIPDMRKTSKPKLFWSIDGHCNFDNHALFARGQGIDIVLNSCLPCVAKMKPFCEKSLWFPNAYPQDLFDAVESQDRTVDVGYCGSLGSPERRAYIDALALQVSMKTDIGALGDKMVRALKGYKISWNRNLGFDVNYRTFESMGAGALLITNSTPGLDLIFTNLRNLVTYKDLEDCAIKIRGFLQDEGWREEIANAGLEMVKKHHTYDARAGQIVELIEGGR